MLDNKYKEWRVRGVQEKDLIIYAKKLQAVLNKMESDGFDFTVEESGFTFAVTGDDSKFLALVTGSRNRLEKSEKNIGLTETNLAVSEEK